MRMAIWDLFYGQDKTIYADYSVPFGYVRIYGPLWLMVLWCAICKCTPSGLAATTDD